MASRLVEIRMVMLSSYAQAMDFIKLHLVGMKWKTDENKTVDFRSSLHPLSKPTQSSCCRHL